MLFKFIFSDKDKKNPFFKLAIDQEYLSEIVDVTNGIVFGISEVISQALEDDKIDLNGKTKDMVKEIVSALESKNYVRINSLLFTILPQIITALEINHLKKYEASPISTARDVNGNLKSE